MRVEHLVVVLCGAILWGPSSAVAQNSGDVANAIQVAKNAADETIWWFVDAYICRPVLGETQYENAGMTLGALLARANKTRDQAVARLDKIEVAVERKFTDRWMAASGFDPQICASLVASQKHKADVASSALNDAVQRWRNLQAWAAPLLPGD